MRPDTPQNLTNDPRGSVPSISRNPSQVNAVANMTRDRISAIYAQQVQPASQPTPQPQPQEKPQFSKPLSDKPQQPSVTVQPQKDPVAQQLEVNAYDRTHSPARSLEKQDAGQWQKYHSEWQKYYQQYYERYYMGAVQQTQTAYQEHAHNLYKQIEKQTHEPDDMTEKEAIHDLRSQLLSKVQTNAKKVRKSKHFVPILSGLAVLAIFLFLQYNSMIIAYAQAYMSPGNVDPQNIIVDPNASLSVDPAPKLIIPKINVDVPVDYNAKPDYDSQMASMAHSVAYFGVSGANSKPGQMGNTPMAGHSSNDFTDNGAVKFVFARLDQLQKGDIFYLNYEGKRYTYSVSKIMVVKPNEVSKLQIGYDKPYATLITCTPLGTAEKRLLVVGEQISPSPSDASSAPTQSDTNNEPSAGMAGKSPTLIERLFGAR